MAGSYFGSLSVFLQRARVPGKIQLLRNKLASAPCIILCRQICLGLKRWEVSGRRGSFPFFLFSVQSARGHKDSLSDIIFGS
jgi:hypothetical protein